MAVVAAVAVAAAAVADEALWAARAAPLPPITPTPCPLPPAVVLTSSMAAISAGFNDRGEGHVYSEVDWNYGVLKTGEPYFT